MKLPPPAILRRRGRPKKLSRFRSGYELGQDDRGRKRSRGGASRTEAAQGGAAAAPSAAGGAAAAPTPHATRMSAPPAAGGSAAGGAGGDTTDPNAP